MTKRYLEPSADPERALEKLAMAHQPPIRRMYRPGFDDLMREMPAIDARSADQSEQVAETVAVLERMRERVMANIGALNIPDIPPGEFGRIILAVEEPKEEGNILIPGTEVVLALWGEGFTSPVHGHAPGYIHEDLLGGAFDVHLYKETGDPRDRKAVYQRTVAQTEPGIFYREYVQDHGQEKRSALIHNFRARRQSISMHYLPEHVRDGNANRFRVVNNAESAPVPSYIKQAEFRPGLKLAESDVRRVTKEEVLKEFKVGDVYLVRSENVAFLGPHFVVITGGMVEKPHGKRPQDLTFLVPDGEKTPLDNYDWTESLVVLKLEESAKKAFYEHYELDERKF